uniref:Zgc:77056 n=1 Tax=Neogobius melanostomus TaxID=47308 RepID=A0A8C6TYQ3_9GOBI
MNKKGKVSGVSWVKPSEPSFLKKFKNDVGYKEGPTVDTKRAVMPTPDDDSSGSDRDDELPQVVVVKTGDLTAEEVKKIKDQTQGDKDDDDKPADGKIVFKKPAKRSSSEKFQGITASSSKKKKSVDDEKEAEKEAEKEVEKKDGPAKKVKTTVCCRSEETRMKRRTEFNYSK